MHMDALYIAVLMGLVVWLVASAMLQNGGIGLLVAAVIAVMVYGNNIPDAEEKEVYKEVFNIDQDQIKAEQEAKHKKWAASVRESARKQEEVIKAYKGGKNPLPKIPDIDYDPSEKNKSAWEILSEK